MFTCSIILPFMVGGLQIALYNPEAIFGTIAISSVKNRVIFSICSLLLAPFHSVILHFKMHYITLKLRANPYNKILLSEKDMMTFHQRKFTKVELGLETIFQLVGLLILLLIADSETKTYPIIGGGTKEIFGIPQENRSLVFLIFGCVSFAFSFLSCVGSHLTVLSVNREYFPLLYSKMMAAIYTIIAITIRVLTIVLFFTPSLGLFDLLRHWQAEQTKWHPDLIQHFVDTNGNIQFGNSSPIPWNLIDRWTKNISEAPALQIESAGYYVTVANKNYYLEPPHYSLYTGFTLKHTFYLFICSSLIHLIIILVIKWKFSFAFKGINLEMLIHALENTNIAYNIKEWDSDKGSAAEHKTRMISNRNEGLALILASTIFNMFNLLPLVVLGMLK